MSDIVKLGCGFALGKVLLPVAVVTIASVVLGLIVVAILLRESWRDWRKRVAARKDRR